MHPFARSELPDALRHGSIKGPSGPTCRFAWRAALLDTSVVTIDRLRRSERAGVKLTTSDVIGTGFGARWCRSGFAGHRLPYYPAITDE